MQGLHALFTGEDDTWEAWLNVDASGFSSVINFGGNGVKLRRGYAASASPKPTQVSDFNPLHIPYSAYILGNSVLPKNIVLLVDHGLSKA